MKRPNAIPGERRRYVRLETPITISYVLPEGESILHTSTKNISADGMRFQTFDKALVEGDLVSLNLHIPEAVNPVHAKAAVIWKKRISLEDGAPYDVGLEFTEIEEDNKNTFLRFLCDIMYALPRESK
ncbi:MAG TPA: PilZ domain-containing protein [Candidatus Omnitrophota bacterium]|nr:PilZ domain-containing protein [Candidatus Omnitrophota bacterium]